VQGARCDGREKGAIRREKGAIRRDTGASSFY